MTKPTAETIAHKRTKILAATVATLGVLILLAVATIYGNFSLTSFAKARSPSAACRNGKCLTKTVPTAKPTIKQMQDSMVHEIHSEVKVKTTPATPNNWKLPDANSFKSQLDSTSVENQMQKNDNSLINNIIYSIKQSIAAQK